MAQLDANIILGGRPAQIESPVNALARVLQVKDMQSQGQMRDMQMQDAMRERESSNKLAELYRSSMGPDGKIDRNRLFQGAAQAGLGTKIPGLQKQFADADEQTGKVDAAAFKLANDRYGVMKQTMGALYQRQDLTKDLVLQAGQELVQAGILKPEMYEKAIATMPDDPMQLRARLRDGLASQMKPEDILTAFAPKPEKIDNGQQISFRDTNPNSPTYGQATGGAPVQKLQTLESIASNATQRRGQNMTDARASERLTYDKSKPTNQPGGRKPMTAAQEAKYREEVAKDYQAANTNLANMNEVLNSIDEVRTAPGLDRATGVMSYLPSMPGGDAAAAEVRLKNLEGKITQLGKAAAAQGGAVGPMAVQEWKIVRDMIAAVDPAKGKQAMLDQIDLIEQTVIGAAERIKDVYSKQYSPDAEMYPQFQELKVPKRGNPAKPKAAASPQDQQALEWANANPNDPRAKQILQRLGGR